MVGIARSMGFGWEKTGGNHLRFTHPAVQRPVIASGTPTCPFAVQKVTRDLRNALKRSQEHH
jgi:hypothetical protein